jgi:hypothetical protein
MTLPPRQPIRAEDLQVVAPEYLLLVRIFGADSAQRVLTMELRRRAALRRKLHRPEPLALSLAPAA